METSAHPTINFTVDTSPPGIVFLSPQNQTYTTTALTLSFTLNETATWTGYSLDGQETVPFTGNISLTGLAYGQHTITVYTKDAYGNLGASETLHLTVEAPFPTLWTAALTAIVTAGAVASLLYFKRFSKTKKPKTQQPSPS